MKFICKTLALLLLFCLTVSLVACDNNNSGGEEQTTDAPNLEFVDYASDLKLDMNTASKKLEVTVHQYVDGDTTHFNVPSDVMPNGVFKARYLAINTPESTGQIEEWGKAASAFTRQKLSEATSIVIESEDGKWNADSTGGRYLVWVWYKTDKDTEYRNLNLEILQNGLAIASNSSQNKYGMWCTNAIKQAKAHKLYVYSKEKDPDFYYGSAIELTLKELRVNPELYVGKDVAFEGVVTKNGGVSVYVEEFDQETNMYHGIYVYYGYSLNGTGLGILNVGNRVRIVGSMQYYEAGGTYQISDLKYDMMNPKSADNIQKISSGNPAAYLEITPETFLSEKKSVTTIDENGEEIVREFGFAELALNTTVSMKDLLVSSVYTTNNGGDSDGAMTFTCTSGEHTILVRTTVLKNADGKILAESDFLGKTIDVLGIVDYYDGTYQIKVMSAKDITIK